MTAFTSRTAILASSLRIGLAVLTPAAFSAGTPPTISLAAYCNGTDGLDDTACIQSWIAAGQASPGSVLYAPAGTYFYHSQAQLYSGMRIRCAGSTIATFRRSAGSGLFLVAGSPVDNVTIEDCGFDVDGSTADFLTVIGINPASTVPSTNINVRRNRFFDRAIMGTMSAQQRQYVLLLNCNKCRVDENRLSEGGRIKLGRPGRELYIRGNIVDRANDNAITVVDIGSGESVTILITRNRITSPKGIGIFFGADGETQTDPALTTRGVRIEGNSIEGDWETACILGTLPAKANKIQLVRNRCLKTGTAGAFRAGIAIKRTNGAAERALEINIEGNRVSASAGLSALGTEPLDMGGLWVSGNYSGFRVHRNEIRRVGPRAMYLSNVDIINGNVTENKMIGGTLQITGSFVGPTAPNTFARSPLEAPSRYASRR